MITCAQSFLHGDIVMEQNTFARWRTSLGLSVGDCATLLGLSLAQVCVLLRGHDGKGRPAIPQQDTRLLMSAASRGLKLAPHPLSAAEEQIERDARRRRLTGRAAMQKAA